ncbi:MAG: hypothetical protein H7Y89_15230 [Steroidobacteraceae bacterium]|nr:hypothetical protein [Steroidobacteraceae bacterium]
MKTSNLALRIEDEPLAMTQAPQLTRTEITAEANEPLFRRPQLSFRFKNRHLDGRAIEISDQGLRLFRVR